MLHIFQFELLRIKEKCILKEYFIKMLGKKAIYVIINKIKKKIKMHDAREENCVSRYTVP